MSTNKKQSKKSSPQMFVNDDVDAAVRMADVMDAVEIDRLYRSVVAACPEVQGYSRAKKTLELYWHQSSSAVRSWMRKNAERLAELLILHTRSAAVTADVDHRDPKFKVVPGKTPNDYDELLRLVKKADRAVGRANALRELSDLKDAPKTIVAKRVKSGVTKLTQSDIKKVVKRTSKPSKYAGPSLFLDDCWSD